MFGGFGQQTGFGQQPQQSAFGQPQQQQQNTSVFGGSAFGAAPAAGGTPGFGAFGQTQPQQSSFGAPPTGFGQPSAPTGFGQPPAAGMFGNPPAAQSTTGFGGFGAPQQQAPGFGAPATGFGSTQQVGGFGSSQPVSTFGAPPSTSPFGATTSTGFGQPPQQTSTFGATPPSVFGNQGNQTTAQTNLGTGNPTYVPTQEKETGALLSSMSSFHSISAMPAYKNWSFEELRFQDYQMNKKVAGTASTTAGFGQASTFGQQPAAQAGFGATATPFGQSATLNQPTGAFGSTPAFGQQPQMNAFGQPQPASTGLFGAPASTPAFGQPANTQTSAFGASAAPAFGQPQAQTGGLFGQPAPQTTTGFGGFGQASQQKPATAWGQAPAFGAATPAPAFGQPAPSTGGLFGAKPATGGFSFGAPAAATQQPTTGLFGAPAATSMPSTGLFGAPSATGGLFATGFSFGAPAATSAPSSLFGSTPAASQPAPGGLFGAVSQPAPGGLFGAPTSQAQPTGFFGATATPASTTAGGLFGAATAPKLGGFGGFNATPQPSMGLFGQPSGGLFGQPAASTTMATPGMFGTGQSFGATPGPGQSLTAGIDKNPYGINPLFTPAKPSGTPAVATTTTEPAVIPSKPTDKKKAILTPHFKMTPRSTSKIKLRGFAGTSPTVASTDPKNLGLKISPSVIAREPITSGLDTRFTPRKTVTKLTLSETPDVPPQLALLESRSKGSSKEVTFDPSLEEVAISSIREKRVLNLDQENISIVKETKTPSEELRSATSSTLNTPYTPARSSDYILEPPLTELLLLSDDELRSVRDFCVSLPNVGSVQFLRPVDLLQASPTGTRVGIDQIPGSIVILEPKVCTVYPDEDVKPPVGFGLNVPAEINLEKCWPVDKATRKPVMDETDPRHDKHMRKLENMPDTRWLGFHNPTGTWRFQVEHFSRYGLLDDEEASTDAVVPSPIDVKSAANLLAGLEESTDDFNESVIKDSFAHIKRSPVKSVQYDDDETQLEYEDEYSELLVNEDSYQEVSDENVESEVEISSDEASESFEIEETLESATPIAFQKKEMTRKVQAMKAALFGNSIGTEPRKFEQKTYFGDKPLDFKVADEETLKLTGKRASSDTSEAGSPKARNTFTCDSRAVSMSNKPSPSPRKYVKSTMLKKETSLCNYENSLIFNQHSNLRDAGLFMGRSFRVGWGPNGTFIRYGSCTQPRSLSKIELCKVHVFEGDLDQIKKRHEISLDLILGKSQVSTVCQTTDEIDEEEIIDENSMPIDDHHPTDIKIPKAIVQSDFEFRDMILNLEKLPNAESLFSHRDISIWKLASALWDSLDGVNEQASYQSERSNSLRKYKFSLWLKWVVMKDKADQKEIDSIWNFLVTRQISKAVSVALKDKNFKLATILSQIGGPTANVILNRLPTTKLTRVSSGHGVTGRNSTDSTLNDDISNQLEIWKKVDEMFDKEMLNVWRLLSGELTLWDSSMIQPLSNWKEMFGLLFWYVDGGALSISEAIETFDLVKKKGPLVATSLSPFPDYVEARSKLSGPYDICYHMMKLFIDEQYSLELLLNPTSFTSNKLDYLHSWSLYQVIAKVKGLSEFKDAKTQQMHEMLADEMIDHVVEIKTSAKGQLLSANLIFQLEFIGLWEWAIFVALYLEDKTLRETTIRGILARNYPMNDDSGSWKQDIKTESKYWKFLVSQLRVPSLWIHEARALHAKYSGNTVQEVVSLIDACLFNAAHQFILSNIAPNAIVSGNFTFLRTLLDKLPRDYVSQWVNGAGILLEYITIMDEVPSLIQKTELMKSILSDKESDMHAIESSALEELQTSWHSRVEDFYRTLLSSNTSFWQSNTSGQVNNYGQIVFLIIIENIANVSKDISRILELTAKIVFDVDNKYLLLDKRLSQISSSSSSWFAESLIQSQ